MLIDHGSALRSDKDTHHMRYDIIIVEIVPIDDPQIPLLGLVYGEPRYVSSISDKAVDVTAALFDKDQTTITRVGS